MNSSAPALSAVATRARIAADVCRTRYAAPETLPVLQTIAAHFDTIADACCSTAPFNIDHITQPLTQAHALMTAHRDARLPVKVNSYVFQPFDSQASSVPLPAPLYPASDQLTAQELVLRARLIRLNADTTAAVEDTDRWFRAVLATLAAWSRLAGEVDADNRRPSNRHAVIAKHIACPECSGHDIRFGVRNWATCTCGYGDIWGAFLACFCFSHECPAVAALTI
ncbi:hypothetical protein AB0C52_12770 [Streptomyces sp. NPDC048717]|uniref:hypothetical protein n=1 Tax=Streptomyces sp. NPDC048717 TaxID=3154928 RepID=UPI00342168FB